MGLIKALTSSVGSAFGDQFKEYVVCPKKCRYGSWSGSPW